MATFRLDADPGVSLLVYRWEPAAAQAVKAVVQVAHGMAEHAARYARFATALNAAGYAVYAADHRGHGGSASSPEHLGDFGGEGALWRVVEDQERLRQRIAADHPGTPVVLFGHSMGSFIMRAYLYAHAPRAAAAILSGMPGGKIPLVVAGRAVARVERARLGPRGRSSLLHAMSFGAYNRAFRPARTPSDWLSRDEAEVDKYCADPACGFTITTQGWIDVLGLIVAIQKLENVRKVPRDLPILVFSGDQDPVGDRGAGVRATLELFARAGLSRVTHRLYPGGRHEMLNETNREEVQCDVIAWLDATLARPATTLARSANDPAPPAP
jgi:alpha-beta hydrolase superfamily lysophospholipase